MQKKIDSQIGSLYLVASKLGLQGVFWSEQAVPMLDCKILLNAEHQLAEYFSGRRKYFDLPLDIIGTEFQKRVWRQLLKIPYGKTKSYKEIAIAIQDQNASRAVGTANSKNPLSIIIPCHRVISADGSLGGYLGGLHIKKKLLALELAD